MKKSEELSNEAAQEENDFKAMGLIKKSIREYKNEKFRDEWLEKFRDEWLEKFRDEWLEKLEERYPVDERTNGSFSIHTDDHGIIDFFPKANKLLIRKDNKWIKPGLKWIIKHLLKK